MIHVIGDYFMTADGNCYTLGKRREGKDGKAILVSTSYHSDACSAISAAAKRALMDSVSSCEVESLSELLHKVKEIESEISGKLNVAFSADCKEE